MSKGILYTMTTVVDGLVKIGKTKTNNFESRMYTLERNGYCNVVGLKRVFAIEVDDYDDKEKLLHNIFSKSQVPGSELFALDINLVVSLLSAFEGTVIYPEAESKDEIFDDAAKKLEEKTPKEKEDDEEEEKVRRQPDKKRARFKFSMVGIRPGEVLTSREHPDICCTVVDERHVEYERKVWTTSALATHLTGLSPLQGPRHFCYNGEPLTDIRKRMEKEEK